MPRLPHFPSRLVDNRSESGVEQRRQQLDQYLRALSQWPLYPQLLLKVFKVRIPEEYVLELANNLANNLDNNVAEPEQQHQTQLYGCSYSRKVLFYQGDKLFEDMNDAVVDAVVDEIYNSWFFMTPYILFTFFFIISFLTTHSALVIAITLTHNKRPLHLIKG